jgi:hypothetical protein
MSDKKSNDPMKRIDLFSDAIFGEPEELERQELDETLLANGVSIEATRLRVYERLRAEARPYWMAQKDLPPALKRALEEFRPDSAPVRSDKELGRRAESRIEHLLNFAVANLPPTSSIGREAFSASFRNQKAEKSAKDQETIDRLEKELMDSLQQEEDDHGQ